ncbi:MAG: hypothetical protein WBB07_17145 [Mycobacterium sp.]
MTGPQDSDASTRPISVAELLAKNGTIGAAPPGGRRRRRRGNSDAVTVAELTGEIPIVTESPVDAGDTATVEGSPVVAAEPPTSNPAEESRPPQRPELADVPVARRGPATKPERSHYPMVARKTDQRSAEMMSPDPLVDDAIVAEATVEDAIDEDAAVAETIGTADTAVEELVGQPDELGIGAAGATGDDSYLQTYLRATSGPLFGGQTVADDLARRGSEDSDPVVGDDLEVAEALEVSDSDSAGEVRVVDAGDLAERPTRRQLAVRGLLIAVQSIVAVAFGAGLFIAFDQLWKWNSIVALVLGVLVILGLVVGVRIVRKTEDIGSTLTAVAVGALVAFGPLALWQAS